MTNLEQLIEALSAETDTKKLGKKAEAMKSWITARELAGKNSEHAPIAAEASAALERLK